MVQKSVHIDNITIKMKRANPVKWICLFEKMISHVFILDMKRVIYSRYSKFG